TPRVLRDSATSVSSRCPRAPASGRRSKSSCARSSLLRGFRAAAEQPLGHVVGRRGVREAETLSEVAAEPTETLQDVLALDSLCDDRDAKTVREVDRRADDGLVIPVAADVLYE